MRIFALCILMYVIGLISGFEFSNKAFETIYDDIEVSNTNGKKEIALLTKYIEALETEVTLREDLTSLIIDASREYKLDPKLLAIVIKSESNFRPNPGHKLPNIVGPGGINTKAHKNLLYNPYTFTGNIYSSAEILSDYIEDSDSLTLAIARYKGLSPLGLAQAKTVIKEYKEFIK